jgi:hypothetical protein
LRWEGALRLYVDAAAQGYIDAIIPEHRPLFGRLHLLILDECPDAAVGLSYQVPPTGPAAAHRPSFGASLRMGCGRDRSGAEQIAGQPGRL